MLPQDPKESEHKEFSKVLTQLSQGLNVSIPVLNGIFGDYLATTNNELAIQAGFYIENQKVDFQATSFATQYPILTSKVCILIHGLVADEHYWEYGESHEHNYGNKLQSDLGYTPFFFRYNSGKHISENGKELSTTLQELVEGYPIPIDQIIFLGHSMGGLVARSGCYYGQQEQKSWLSLLEKIILIGSPHLGAPLEKWGNAISNILKAIPRPYLKLAGDVANLRSAGIKDLRYGNTIDEDWKNIDPDLWLTNLRTPIPH